jgi:hypothetical protein
MTDAKFSIGDDVFTTGSRGEVLEVRWINEREYIYGVVDVNGAIAYYQERALRAAG